jgi:hypothetical protein
LKLINLYVHLILIIPYNRLQLLQGIINHLSFNIMKKILVGLLSTALLCSSIAYVSCNKDPQSVSETKKKQQYQLISGTLYQFITESPASSSNPYDDYGVMHNFLVSSTRNTWDDPNATIDATYDAVVANYPNSTQLLIAYKTDVLALAQTVAADSENGLPNMISASSLSDAGKNYASGIISNMMNLDNFNTYTDYKNSILSIESSVSGNSSLTTSEKAILFKMATTARHSMLFWANHHLSDMYPGGPSTPPVATPMGIWGDIKAYVKAHKAEFAAVVADAGSYLGNVLKDPPMDDGDAAAIAAVVSLTAFIAAS